MTISFSLPRFAFTENFLHFCVILAMLVMCLSFIYLFMLFIHLFILLFIVHQGVPPLSYPSLYPSSTPYTLQDGMVRGGTKRGVEAVKGVGERQPLGAAGEERDEATRQKPQKVLVVSLSSKAASYRKRHVILGLYVYLIFLYLLLLE